MSRRAVSLLVASIFVWSCADEGEPLGPSDGLVEETAVAQSSATGSSVTNPSQSQSLANADAGTDTPTQRDAGDDVPSTVDGAVPSEVDAAPPAESDAGSGDAGEPEDDAGDDDGDASEPPAVTGPGLPCAVKSVFYERCVGCHAMNGRAGVSVVTRTDLMADSPAYPGTMVIERAVERMRMTDRPMPPRGEAVGDGDIAAIEAWIADGMPAGSCD